MCNCDWRHRIAVATNIATKRLIIHEAKLTHKFHHKQLKQTTYKNTWENRKRSWWKLQVISRWPRARQCRGPVRMFPIKKGVGPLVRIPAVTNDTKRGSKRKRTESKLEVPVDLRVGLRTYFIALMLEEKLFIMRDQSLCLFFRADRV